MGGNRKAAPDAARAADGQHRGFGRRVRGVRVPGGVGALGVFAYMAGMKYPPRPGVLKNIMLENNIIRGCDDSGPEHNKGRHEYEPEGQAPQRVQPENPVHLPR